MLLAPERDRVLQGGGSPDGPVSQSRVVGRYALPMALLLHEAVAKIRALGGFNDTATRLGNGTIVVTEATAVLRERGGPRAQTLARELEQAKDG